MKKKLILLLTSFRMNFQFFNNFSHDNFSIRSLIFVHFLAQFLKIIQNFGHIFQHFFINSSKLFVLFRILPTFFIRYSTVFHKFFAHFFREFWSIFNTFFRININYNFNFQQSFTIHLYIFFEHFCHSIFDSASGALEGRLWEL